jgi:hypothetical protein
LFDADEDRGDNVRPLPPVIDMRRWESRLKA